MQYTGISLRAVKAGFSSEHAETMCRGNTRFLLGCCRLLGYSRHVISLHMFAVEHVVREIQAVLEGRGVLAGRKYQLYQEIRLIIWWMADKMRDAASTAAMILENPRTVLSSYHYVEVCLDGYTHIYHLECEQTYMISTDPPLHRDYWYTLVVSVNDRNASDYNVILKT